MIKRGSRVRAKTNDKWNGREGRVEYQDTTVAPCRETTWAVMPDGTAGVVLFEQHELEEL